MRLTRIYTPGPLTEGSEILLTGTGANHVARVLRLRVGATIGVFNGDGRECSAAISSISGKQVKVRIHDSIANGTESALRLTLIQGISRAERMDWVVQKATELGVAGLVPVTTNRGIVKLDRAQAAKKLEHWHSIAIAACEQCGRSRVPHLTAPISLTQFIANRKADNPQLSLVLDPNATDSISGPELPNKSSACELLIGPEGGLDDEELASAMRAGFRSVRLGPRILRTETAAIAALAVLQGRWGDLR
jgi:16S rRNA (uracil1498-N3)-methyltransferase